MPLQTRDIGLFIVAFFLPPLAGGLYSPAGPTLVEVGCRGGAQAAEATQCVAAGI